MEFSIYELLLGMAGGIFGAAIGAFPVWILCGLTVLLGSILDLSGLGGGAVTAFAWGSFIGPHTSFAGGAAAAAYAARKGYIESGRDISTALIGLNRPVVIAIGGVFGALGYIILWFLLLIPNYEVTGFQGIAWTNHVALAVIINMILGRLIIGRSGLFGNMKGVQNIYKPSDKGKWLPYQSSPEQILVLSVGVGLSSSILSFQNPLLVALIFGFVNVAYIFMLMGYNVPVCHHIALAAGSVTALTGSIEWGLMMGILSGFIGELCAVYFVYYGDSHIDPPTFALAIIGTLVPIFALCGLFDIEGPLMYVVLIVTILILYFVFKKLRA